MPATLTGYTQSGSGAYGTVPEYPSPTATQADAVAGNLSNLGTIEDLASQTNTFNSSQALQQYINNLPNYSAMTAASSDNILNNLNGVLSPDVTSAITQAAAERGVSTGAIGSSNANSALLRSLGLTSYGLQQTGESQLTDAIKRTPTASLFDTASYFVTPAQQQEAQLGSNIYASSYSPSSHASAELEAAKSGVTAGTKLAGSAPSMTAGMSSGLGGNTQLTPSAPSAPTSVMSGSGADFPSGGGSSGFGGGSGSSNIFGFGTDSTATSGYQPTSSGSMYMGDFAGYNGNASSSTNWGDAFANYMNGGTGTSATSDYENWLNGTLGGNTDTGSSGGNDWSQYDWTGTDWDPNYFD